MPAPTGVEPVAPVGRVVDFGSASEAEVTSRWAPSSCLSVPFHVFFADLRFRR